MGASMLAQTHRICPPLLKTTSGQAYLTVCNRICSDHQDDELNSCNSVTLWLSMLRPTPIQLDNQQLNLHSLDNYDQALGEFTLGDLKALESNAKRLIEEIEKLKRTFRAGTARPRSL